MCISILTIAIIFLLWFFGQKPSKKWGNLSNDLKRNHRCLELKNARLERKWKKCY